jgi:hypothetical protein
MGHARWSEVDARGVLESWRRSGLSLERFAKQRGFVAQRLRWWKAKFARTDNALAAGVTAALLPVRVSAERGRRGEPVTVLLRTGHVIKVAHDFDEHAFARVVALLEGG